VENVDFTLTDVTSKEPLTATYTWRVPYREGDYNITATVFSCANTDSTNDNVTVHVGTSAELGDTQKNCRTAISNAVDLSGAQFYLVNGRALSQFRKLSRKDKSVVIDKIVGLESAIQSAISVCHPYSSELGDIKQRARTLFHSLENDTEVDADDIETIIENIQDINNSLSLYTEGR
jgi:hypothetical protein